MKYFYTLLTLTLFSSYALADSVEVKVNGMVCDFCAVGLEKTLGKKDEIENLQVSFDNGTVNFSVKEGSEISDEQIRATIEDNGISVVDIKRSENKTD